VQVGRYSVVNVMEDDLEHEDGWGEPDSFTKAKLAEVRRKYCPIQQWELDLTRRIEQRSIAEEAREEASRALKDRQQDSR